MAHDFHFHLRARCWYTLNCALCLVPQEMAWSTIGSTSTIFFRIFSVHNTNAVVPLIAGDQYVTGTLKFMGEWAWSENRHKHSWTHNAFVLQRRTAFSHSPHRLHNVWNSSSQSPNHIFITYTNDVHKWNVWCTQIENHPTIYIVYPFGAGLI